MLPISVYPDAEAAVIAYLQPQLVSDKRTDHVYDWSDVEIGVRGGDGHFVRVRRVGGLDYTPNHDRPTLDVIVFHDTDRLRMLLANHLWAVLRAANNDPATGSNVDAVIAYDSTVVGPMQMPDPADDTRVVCMFTVTLIIRPR